MSLRAEEQKQEAVAAAASLAAERLDAARASAVQRFLKQFYGHAPAVDVLERKPEDLYGAALSLWQFAQVRSPGRAKLRVVNPRIEVEGWRAPATVVEIVNDDMPFLVDSVTAALNGEGAVVRLVIHPILRLGRDAGGKLTQLYDSDARDGARESVMHIEISSVTDEKRMAALEARLGTVLADVRIAVADWRAIRDTCMGLRQELQSSTPPVAKDERDEAAEFLAWLADDNFTFLGYREYRYGGGANGGAADILPRSGLGILRDDGVMVFEGLRNFATLPSEVRAFLMQPRILNISKSNRRSTVHRAVRMDTIAVRKFGADGRAAGERLFVGLFTSASYARSARSVPMLRRKVSRALERAGFEPSSHDGKALTHIIETFPRDELFQLAEDELLDISLGILGLQERQRTALFARRDPYGRFVSVFVYVPRDRYNTELRQRFAAILEKAYRASVDSFTTQLDESVLARVHFILRIEPGPSDVDLAALERELEDAARSWADRLQEALVRARGEELGLALVRRYGAAFPVEYRDRFPASAAIHDIESFEQLRAGAAIAVTLHRPLESLAGELRFKIYRRAAPVPLSDILPMLEHMGLKVMAEVPYEVRESESPEPLWMQDFSLLAPAGEVDVGRLKPRFEDAFSRIWGGAMESDGFNRLILLAGLDWRQVTVLRLYAKVMRQAGSTFSQAYMEDALAHHPGIAAKLMRLFEARFDPARANAAKDAADALAKEIEADLDQVTSLDEDRIIRGFLVLISRSLRTNHYQRQPDGAPKPYLSVKLASREIDLFPLPRPLCEIYVHGARMEGVHLRGGKVARGGIRWSDRKEDFRTEILGLMKAQMVKNAVIVPTGSKGGFVVKRPPATREALQAEVVACYTTLMQGMLDITDTIAGDALVPPKHVVRHDGDDPYLVVAADKGTATFSDIANGIALEYGFWLGDAFASGGSDGYDHKAMAITARGAWETVKRHFRELGVDIQSADFTCVGVGDMSGDVFGNGMLRSQHTKLVAAFDHRHVFLDPDPDPAKAFAERKRLFDLPRSSWGDYDKGIISMGGGVFERSLKSVPLSPEARARLGIAVERATPMELIQAILRAPVDLLWFGGIGTYVKASYESQGEAGDRANDGVRIDGAQIRARVVGEGANLAVTQRGRIEYALAGGHINTDAIDNSAGVDTSDHEVNIKILLNAAVASGDLTMKQRNELLHQMTDEVAALVLRDNYLQGLALSLEEHERVDRFDRHVRVMRELERAQLLDRAIEELPDDETLTQRGKAHLGLTRPELAVMLAYVKTTLTEDLLNSDLPDDPQLADDLFAYFPPELVARFRAGILAHRLRREIIATVAANDLVNRAGIAFARELGELTGRGAGDVTRAYMVVRRVYDLDAFWEGVGALDNKVPAEVQHEMLLAAGRLVERATAWFLRNPKLDIAAETGAYRAGIAALAEAIDTVMPQSHSAALAARARALEEHGVPAALARTAARLDFLVSAVDIVKLAVATGQNVVELGQRFFAIGARFRLDALRLAARKFDAHTAWQKRAVAAVSEDLYAQQAELTAKAVAESRDFEAWIERHARDLGRLEALEREIEEAPAPDLAMLTVATRALRGVLAS
ncbi:MAG TPA: NAD-glutamate dehydrogenase domain-containing protein [Stellaceae bacterium]|nr:NAD-glutamate dehydrogenase domain-containing protein [Stellaceae bacterium]